MSYDFTAASEFFDEIKATPQEVRDEIERTIEDMHRDRVYTIQKTRILGLLSVFSKLVGRVTPKTI